MLCTDTWARPPTEGRHMDPNARLGAQHSAWVVWPTMGFITYIWMLQQWQGTRCIIMLAISITWTVPGKPGCVDSLTWIFTSPWKASDFKPLLMIMGPAPSLQERVRGERVTCVKFVILLENSSMTHLPIWLGDSSMSCLCSLYFSFPSSQGDFST
jgi:hypothetical protein